MANLKGIVRIFGVLGLFSAFLVHWSNHSALPQTNSNISFLSFDFVTVMGRIGHEGLLPIPGQPTNGNSQLCLARLQGPYKTAEFRLISEQLETLQTINLTQGHSDAGERDFVGSIILPRQSFKVAVQGIDLQGMPYAVIYPKVFRPQPVEIHLSRDRVLVTPGRHKIVGSVTNFGPADQFFIELEDDKHYIDDFETVLVRLETGQSFLFDVGLSVPRGTPSHMIINLLANVKSATNAETANQARLRLVTEFSDKHSFAITLEEVVMKNVNRGTFELMGIIELPVDSNGINPRKEGAIIRLGQIVEEIPARHFRSERDRFRYQSNHNKIVKRHQKGVLKEVRLDQGGRFRIVSSETDLTDFFAAIEIPFSITISDDMGETVIKASEIEFINRKHSRYIKGQGEKFRKNELSDYFLYNETDDD